MKNSIMPKLAKFKMSQPLLVIIVIFLLLRIPSLFEGFWYQDEGFYAAIGKSIFDGKTIYLDIWDHKPPLMYLIYGFFFKIFSAEMALLFIKLMGMLLGVLSIKLTWEIGKQLSASKSVAITMTAFTAFSLGLPFLEGNLVNMEVVFINISLAIILLILKKRSAAIIGVLSFVALLIKPQILFESIFLCVLAYIYFKDFRNINVIAKGLAGFLLPATIFTLILTLTGLLEAFINASFLENMRYAGSYSGTANIFNIFLGSLLTKVIFLSGSLAAILLLHYKKKLSATAAYSLSLLAGELVLSVLSGREYAHYFLQMLPGLALLVGLVSRSVQLHPEAKTITISMIFVLVTSLGTLGGSPLSHVLPTRYYTSFLENKFLGKQDVSVPVWINLGSSERMQELKSYFDSNYRKDTSFYLYSENPWILIFINGISQNKYVVWYHLRYSNEIFQEELIKAKAAKVLIVDTSSKEIIPEFINPARNCKNLVTTVAGFDIYEEDAECAD